MLSFYFVKHSPNLKLFQIEVVDLNEVCALRHISIALRWTSFEKSKMSEEVIDSTKINFTRKTPGSISLDYR
jgi:hypothetical protein